MNPSDKKSDSSSPWQQREPPESSVWGILLAGLVGATATTLMVGRLRRTVDWFYTQMNRSQSSRRNATGSSHRGGGSSREEARNAYNRRMQEEYEDEMERVERIRRVQSVFNRERNKHRSYESWRENDSSGHQYHQNFQRDDWYWKTNTSYKDKRHNDQRTNFRSTPRDNGNYSMLHHYSVLGLDRSRANTYSEAEIKRAGLKSMIQSEEWLKSKFSTLAEGMKMEKIILDNTFWRKLEKLQTTISPLTYVLRMVDGDKQPAMGLIYDALDRAKLAISEAYENKPERYMKFWKIIDARWESTLHSPLHAAGYFLNPAIRYRGDFSTHPEVRRGLQTVIGRLLPDMNDQIDALSESAFRTKAMEYHPDQNQNNKDAAEAKFKEVMISYEAIKVERKKGSC